MRFILLYYLLIFSVISCNNNQSPYHRHNNIKQIFFATGGCYGPCPYFAIEIDSSLSYNFQGNKYAEKSGTFKGRISQGFWDTLNIKFENAQFEGLDTLYNQSVDDLSTEVIIYYGNKRKRILGQSMILPPKLMEAYNWLLLSYKKIDLKPVFQTVIQNPLPPQPLKNELRVIPPKK
jgi:hypothetical protein